MKPSIRLLRTSLWSLVPHFNGRADVPMRDIAVLLFILERGQPTTSSDVQVALGIEQPKVVAIVDRLRAFRLVEKYRDDQGRVVFSATPEGVSARDTLQALLT